MADNWVDVLKAGWGSVHDNFFELGGHSLLTTQTASGVQMALQLDVPLRAMFECNTVAELAEYVQGLQGSALDDDKVDRLSDLMAELEGL
nr:phosphopantetheine-binding protein [Pseudomonas sp. UBA4617]